MKPILYSSNETAFDTNGIGVLFDAIECHVLPVLNGQYELTLKYPASGVHYKALVRRAIILAKPDPASDPQPFRIYRRIPSSNGTITVYARHIAYDLMGVVVSPFSAAGAPAALQALGDNAATDCPFTFWTDKPTDATITVAVPTAIWTLLGNSEGSVLDCFGGEYEFDRFAVKLWNRRGADCGVSIRYGKNLTSLEQDENVANTYTGVYPYWLGADGTLVQLTEKIVAASGTYDHVRIMPLDLSQEFQAAPTEEQLRVRAEQYMANNDIGTPSISWKVQHVDLEKTEEYKSTAILERVLLGDTVSVEFADMGVSASARVVAVDYDPIRERYNSITLGSVKANIATTIAQQQQQIDKTPSVVKSTGPDGNTAELSNGNFYVKDADSVLRVRIGKIVGNHYIFSLLPADATCPGLSVTLWPDQVRLGLWDLDNAEESQQGNYKPCWKTINGVTYLVGEA